MKPQVICLPGGVAPAAQRYAPLEAALDGSADLQLKDLEVYRDDAPPTDYSVELELAALDRFADSLGLDRFHLIGYSGGGFISLAYAGMYTNRLLSLALFEPARVPGEMTVAEQDFADHLASRLAGLRGPDYMAAFVREQVKPGVELPPAPPPNPAMAKRPGGIAAMQRAFDAFKFDRNLLRDGRFPVYYAYGDLSHEEQGVKAGVLARLFPDIQVRRFEGVHHFVPADQIYSRAHAAELQDLWHRAGPS
ncbi:MAG TPA: alpha/beta fold hydrolase [Candidatus Micrarchaeaceae archaeon]|nr:alpha/beta fold hydrolase [Candidatus Micrarchaeaceae archaeon]